MFSNLRYLISNAVVLFSNYTAKVREVYRNMDMVRDRISFTFDPSDMVLSLHISVSFVKTAMADAVLKRTSGLEPSSETIATR